MEGYTLNDRCKSFTPKYSTFYKRAAPRCRQAGNYTWIFKIENIPGTKDMDMLKRDSRLLLVLVVTMLFVACKHNKSNEEMVELLKELSNSKECYSIRAIAKDTLTSWIKEKLNNRSCEDTISYGNSWIIDRTVAFNLKKDRVVMAVLYSNKNMPTAVMDEISFLYGAKIQSKWYFFHDAIIHIPREMYVSKDKLNEPLSFAKLHEIAMKEVFDGYLVKNAKGKWEINESFFRVFDASNWVAFNERKSNPNRFTSCENISNLKDYLECCYRKTAESIWITEKQYVKLRVPIYTSIDRDKKLYRILEKGERIRVFEYVDGGVWCKIRSEHFDTACSYIQQKYITKELVHKYFR